SQSATANFANVKRGWAFRLLGWLMNRKRVTTPHGATRAILLADQPKFLTHFRPRGSFHQGSPTHGAYPQYRRVLLQITIRNPVLRCCATARIFGGFCFALSQPMGKAEYAFTVLLQIGGWIE